MATIIFDILVAYAQYLDSFLFVLARRPYSCHNCNTTLRKPIPYEACSKNGCTLIPTCMIPQLRTQLRTRTRVTPGPPHLRIRLPDPGPQLRTRLQTRTRVTPGPPKLQTRPSDPGPHIRTRPRTRLHFESELFQPSKNITRRSFSKTAITFAYELETGQIFFHGHLQKIFNRFRVCLRKLRLFYERHTKSGFLQVKMNWFCIFC